MFLFLYPEKLASVYFIKAFLFLFWGNTRILKREYIIVYDLLKSFVWFGFFVKWHIILRGWFNTKAILVEEHQ